MVLGLLEFGESEYVCRCRCYSVHPFSFLNSISNLSTGVDVIELFDADFLWVEFLGCL
jgi:hypothetical protein